MREFMTIVETHNHPHARGEDEWYKYLFGTFSINVDEARRLISNGTIKAKHYDMPVKKGGVMLQGLTEKDFGSRDFRNDSEKLKTGPISIPMVGHADAGEAIKIPDDKMTEPLLMLMWHQYEATKAVIGNGKKPLEGLQPGASYPVLVDGNHRLLRRFLEGSEGTLSTLVVTDWQDICLFTYHNGQRLVVKKSKINTTL